MQAIVRHEYGPPEVLELDDVAPPEPAAEEVLVRVRAAGVDRATWHMMRGLPSLVRLAFGVRSPKEPVLGRDLAGVVEAVGADVTAFEPGDEVFGWCTGAYAEYACAAADHFLAKPDSISFEQAAAIPDSAVTALHALRDEGDLETGEDVLIIGASGGVGSFAVQIATADGARVTGVCSTAKTDFVASLGADDVIDYTTEDVLAADRQYDLILDIAGNRPLSRLRESLRSEGTLVIVGGEDGGRLTGGMGRQLLASILSPFVAHRLRWFVSSTDQQDLRDLAALVEAGDLVPAVDETFPLAEAADAYRSLEDGEVSGKAVLTV